MGRGSDVDDSAFDGDEGPKPEQLRREGPRTGVTQKRRKKETQKETQKRDGRNQNGKDLESTKRRRPGKGETGTCWVRNGIYKSAGRG